MFADLSKYLTKKEFRSGFDDSFIKYRGFCEQSEFSMDLVLMRDNLRLQYEQLLECESYYARMQDFSLEPDLYFDQAFDLNSISSFDFSRREFIEKIMEIMFVTRSCFGCLEIQYLYGNVVSSHQVYDVVYSLRLLDFVDSLLKNEPNSEYTQKIIQSDEIEVFGETFNKTIFDYVGVRLLGFDPRREMSSIRSFVKFLETK